MDGLVAYRQAMVDRLEDAWEGIAAKSDDISPWLSRLALQLQLWVGAELTDPLYYEASFDDPPSETRSDPSFAGSPWNAWSSAELYLRALTKSYFVDVRVTKASCSVEPTDISIFVAPRDRLSKLQATEMSTRGDQADSIRMSVTYEGDARSFDIPRGDTLDEKWRQGASTDLFQILQADLWRAAVRGGHPHIAV